jgi:hypothetical protein
VALGEIDDQLVGWHGVIVVALPRLPHRRERRLAARNRARADVASLHWKSGA